MLKQLLLTTDKNIEKEITFASEVCSQNSIPHEIVNLNLEKILSGSALVGSSEIPEGNYDKRK